MVKRRSVSKVRQKLSRELGKIWGKMKGENPKTIERTIDGAVKSTRKLYKVTAKNTETEL